MNFHILENPILTQVRPNTCIMVFTNMLMYVDYVFMRKYAHTWFPEAGFSVVKLLLSFAQVPYLKCFVFQSRLVTQVAAK